VQAVFGKFSGVISY